MLQAERDAQGRFAPGNRGGPGRPARPVETDYLRALSDTCPLEVWQRIVQRAVADAEAGDARAREWLGAYLLGRAGEPAVSLRYLVQIDELVEQALAKTQAKRSRRAAQTQGAAPREPVILAAAD